MRFTKEHREHISKALKERAIKICPMCGLNVDKPLGACGWIHGGPCNTILTLYCVYNKGKPEIKNQHRERLELIYKHQFQKNEKN
jgi:ribosomal protein L32